MQLSFLFWNLQKRSIKTRVSRVLQTYRPSIALFAECEMPSAELLASINKLDDLSFSAPISLAPKLVLLTSLPVDSVVERYNSISGRYTLWSIRIPNQLEILLCGLHFQSKMGGWTDSDQALEATYVVRDIRRHEENDRHQRTVVIGDFNMNPYGPGIVASHSFHGTMTTALCKPRTVAGREYEAFYNPMWGLFGDRTDGPPGTYFYRSSQPVNTFWYMLDQILLRPQLASSLAEVNIIESDGHESLLKNGVPDTYRASDHLPIFCSLNLKTVLG